MSHRCLALVACAVSSLALAQPAPQASTGARFDGPWQVTIACPHNTEKSAARGYRRQFDATVKEGVLSGEIGDAKSPGWLRIDGRIGADGNALLDARGRTGNPDYAVEHPAAVVAVLVPDRGALRRSPRHRQATRAARLQLRLRSQVTGSQSDRRGHDTTW